jgi:copper chaperone NosL
MTLGKFKEKVFGPSVPAEIIARSRVRFWLPTIVLLAAAGLLLISMFLPYWKMELKAPQYPRGLEMTVYVNRVQGDVYEVDGLNHYIGMRPISEAAPFERSVAVISIAALAFLVVASVFVHNPCALLLTWPVMAYPGIFLLDLWLWMRAFGNDLDPTAPLSNIIEPFTPPIIGYSKIAQFETQAIWGPGLWMAIGVSVLTGVGIFLHRRAYKPLLDEARAKQTSQQTGFAGVKA